MQAIGARISATETTVNGPTDVRPGLRDRVARVLIPALLVVLYAPTITWLLERWTLSVWHHAHGLLIPPIVGYFCWLELRRYQHVPSTASMWGFVFFVPALAMLAVDAGLHTQLLSAVSLVLVLPGLSLLFFGVTRTRAIAFPLAFLLFMLPIPLYLTEGLHMALRRIAAVAVAAVLPWVGIPVYADGTTLHIANATLEVADACSGFSTLYAACAIACLTAYSCSSAWRRVLVIAAAAPLAVAANLLRVLLLVLLVYWQGSDVLATELHTLSGILTFALALPVIFWLGNEPRAERARA